MSGSFKVSDNTNICETKVILIAYEATKIQRSICFKN